MTDDTRRGWRSFFSNEQLVPAVLFIVVSSVYFATITGITDGNAGSHYAAVRAIADTGHLDIAGFEEFTQHSDYARGVDGALHSDRPPGMALLGALTYSLGRIGPPPPVQVPSNHDGENPYVVYAVAAAALCGAGSVLLFYAILREHYEVSVSAALLAALVLAFGTTTWKYSTTLYTHAPTALFTLLALWLALRTSREQNLPPSRSFVLGFALGASALSEYTNAIFVLLVLVYLAATLGKTFANGLRNPAERQTWLLGAGGAALGSAIPAVFFFAYNKVLFGGFFELPIYWVDPVLWSCCTTFKDNFSTPLLSGLNGNLFYGNKNQGIFLLMPVTILALFGWRAMWQRSRRDFVLIVGTFVLMLMVFSKVATVNPDTDDSRYIAPFLALWFVPLGVWLDRFALRRESDLARLAVNALFYGLLFLSVRNIFMHIAFSWNYDLRLETLANKSIPPETISALLGTVFRSASNVHLLLLCEIIVGGLVWVAWRGWRTLPERVVRVAVPVAGGAGLLLLTLLAASMMRPPDPPPNMTPIEAEFETAEGGRLHLTGYYVPNWAGPPDPGDPFPIRLDWQAEGDVSGDYTITLWLEDEHGERWGEADYTLGAATWRERPPESWRRGEVFQEEYVVPLVQPADEDTVVTLWAALNASEAMPILTIRLNDWTRVNS